MILPVKKHKRFMTILIDSSHNKKMEKQTRMRHNCTKEGKFKFTHIALTTDETDKIKCEVCGRVW